MPSPTALAPIAFACDTAPNAHGAVGVGFTPPQTSRVTAAK
jgi:hypothetical protein